MEKSGSEATIILHLHGNYRGNGRHDCRALLHITRSLSGFVGLYVVGEVVISWFGLT